MQLYLSKKAIGLQHAEPDSLIKYFKRNLLGLVYNYFFGSLSSCTFKLCNIHTFL